MKRKLTLIFFSIMFAVCSAFAVSGCAETTSDGTEKHNHTYTTNIVSPTCEGQGYTLHICSCGESYKDNYVAALAHNFENYLCTECNQIDPKAPDTEGLEYSLSRDGERYVVCVSGIGTVTGNYVKIPSTHNGEPVTLIRKNAFSKCNNLKGITIPNSVKAIGDYAFYQCYHLKSITIPNSVKTIGDYAFSNCKHLTSITISNSITKIESCTFNECSRLTSITIPNGVTSIGEFAFDGCSNLMSITIPNSVTEIERAAFRGCRSLTSINYTGMKSQWAKIELMIDNRSADDWDYYTDSYIIHCTDGDMAKSK